MQNVIILPIAIGDTVFRVVSWANEVRQGKVSMLQQKADGTWKFRISEGSFVYDLPITDIGINVFLSYAEAQAQLNKMEI